MTGSGAVFAEGLHSGVDIFSSAISFVGIKIAKKPVDKKHPYGYYKFDVLAGSQIEEKIEAITSLEKIKINSIKTQKKDLVVMANLEIELPNNLNLEEATKASDKLRSKLLEKIESLKCVAI